MDIRTLSPDFAVAPQITVEDVATLADQGFTHVICNRPAFESAPSQAGEMETDAIMDALEKAGYPLGGLRGQIEMLAQR